MSQAVFRCDVLPLLAMVGLHITWTRQLAPAAAIYTGVASAAAAVAATAPCDSLLWGRTVWPELDVLWFNVVSNRCGSLQPPQHNFPEVIVVVLPAHSHCSLNTVTQM